MKILLSIGYTTLILPNDKGLQTTIKTLTNALRCADYTHRTPPAVQIDPRPLEISIKYLPHTTRLSLTTPTEPHAHPAPGDND